jgi:molecular chaperone GrpE
VELDPDDLTIKSALAIFLTDLPLHSILIKMADKEKKGMNEPFSNEAEMDINTDENQNGSTHLNEPVGEESELAKLRDEVAVLNDKYVRKVAEFENYKRRNAKERMELIQTAGRDVITELLDVLDDCDRAQKQMEITDDPATIKEGVLLVFNKFRNIMQSRGVKAMETINTEFNPDLHEAITEIPATSSDLKGKVVDEVTKGYYLNDKIIRHAKVVVGK